MQSRFNLQGTRQTGMSETLFCDLTGPGSKRRTPASTGKSTGKIQPAAPGSSRLPPAPPNDGCSAWKSWRRLAARGRLRVLQLLN